MEHEKGVAAIMEQSKVLNAQAVEKYAQVRSQVDAFEAKTRDCILVLEDRRRRAITVWMGFIFMFSDVLV